MNINPCLLMPENWVIAFHRKYLAIVMVIEIFFILCLRVISFYCEMQHSQKYQTSPHFKEENMIKIEVIEQSVIEAKSSLPFSIQGSQLFILPPTKRSKSQIKQQTIQQKVKIKNIQAVPQSKSYQNAVIRIKNLVLFEQDIRNITCIELGQQFICIAIAILYYPFAYNTIICTAQMLLFIIHYIARIFSDILLTKLVKGAIYLLNIGMMSLSIYGLCSNILLLKCNSCFDL